MSQDSPRPRKRRRVQDYDALPTPPDSHTKTPSSRSTGDVPDEGQSADTDWRIITHGPPAGEDPNTTTTQNEPESKENPSLCQTELACFGMIKDIVVELSKSQSVEPGGIIPVTLGEPNTLLRDGGKGVLAKLAQRTATTLRNLMTQCTLQLFCLARLRQGRGNTGGSGDHAHRGKRQPRTSVTLCVNVYGPPEMGEGVGDFFTESGLHLQDPMHCDRDVVYCNPHLLFVDGELVTTLSLAAPFTAPDIEQVDDKPDLFELLRNEQPLAEAETPATLATSLFSHQKQALTFMLRREAGWDFTGPNKDIWEKESESTGRIFYTNTVTGHQQDHEPPDFRGGLLADQMGLGKSLSMIALIAANPFHPLNETVASPRTTLAPVKTTLLVVPSPLLRTWEYQLMSHTKPGTITSCIYHGNHKRTIALQGQFDVVITTFKTLALQWERTRKIKHFDSPADSLLSVLWHRVILDEAHVIQNRKTSIARACSALNATNRWALTGTPIQNRLTNLASIFEFLKIYPFSDPKIFDAEITKPWLYGDQQGVLRLKTLVNYVTLCRTKSVVNLPRRFDQIHHLDFSSPEQEIYDAAKIRTADMLDDAIMSRSERRGLYLNVLQWLNALRLICNHGVLESRRGQVLSEKELDDDEEEWNERKAQAAFQEMLCAGAAICSNCIANLSESYETPGQDSSDLGPLRLLSCLQLLCDTCFQEKSEQLCCPACPSDSRCSAMEVSVFEDAAACSSACSPGKSISDADMPIKLKALVKNLEDTRDSKSVVFSYWTLTLDFVEIALDAASISYIRLDGKMSAEKRTNAMLQFQQDPDIQVILVSITCGGAGLDLTAASRAYLLEPQWNPMIEEQAMCRIYRMGQKKDVTTIRYRIRDSFEENVVAIQDRKKDLASLTFSKERLSENDIGPGRLQYLRSVLG